MAETDDKTPASTQDAEAEVGAVEQSQKHDESFKSLLSTNEAIAHFLTKYFSESWVSYVSANKIVRIDNSFITSEYCHIDSDLIYKLQLGDSDVYFYVLLELQSKVDFTMPLRLLRYMVELLKDIFKNTDEDERQRKDFRVPAIVPIVLYNGYDNWTAFKPFREYTKNYELFGNHIIDFEYLLFNLKQTDENAILPIKNVLDAFFSLDKRRLEKRLSPEEFKDWWAEQAPQLSAEDKNTLLRWVRYVMYKGKLSPENMETLIESLKKGDERTMKHGLAAWRDELIEETQREDALKFANFLKAKGFSVDEIAEATGLTVDEIIRL
jgi:predicted transposase/invertase (TIGR01784 family)